MKPSRRAFIKKGATLATLSATGYIKGLMEAVSKS